MTRSWIFSLVLSLGLLVAWADAAPSLYLLGSESLPPDRVGRLQELLEDSKVESLEVGSFAEVPAGSRVLSLGATPVAAEVFSQAERSSLPPEGFLVARAELRGRSILAVYGARQEHAEGPNRGLLFGAYEALERMGFEFLHPLRPRIPDQISWPAQSLRVREAPHWPLRSLHLHTMHPLELTNLLNGWGKTGPDDQAGFESMLPWWDRTLDWMAAHGQNSVEWVLLEHRSWRDFSQSETRLARLKQVVAKAQSFGFEVGLDVPIALAQQNAFRLITGPGDPIAQMQARVDWLLETGANFLSTEIGFSEFTSPDDRDMLAWLNAFTEMVSAKPHALPQVKVHCSVSSKAKHFRDPDTGQKLNINYLPYFADPRLAVQVHTVQMYGLEDPAPTYGRQDFRDLERYLSLEAGRRPVIWYPETAYWVSYDVDMPLFLPVYAGRRLRDLRRLGQLEAAGSLGRGENKGSRIQGQVVFSSGWEWGYWLNDVIAAEAAWNPHLEIENEAQALRALLKESLRHWPQADQAAELLAETIEGQHQSLILGQGEALVGELPDPRPGKQDDPILVPGRLTGQAYMQGVETWDDFSDLLNRLPFVKGFALTQPQRLGPVNVRGRRATREYEGKIRPLLTSMQETFLDQAERAEAALSPEIPEARDLRDGFRINWLRVRQVLGLYDKASRMRRKDKAWKEARFQDAVSALDEALVLAKGREADYAVDPEHLAGWGKNPTSYPFGYLWTARNLYYWFRDEGKVREAPKSPCYMNFLHAAEIGTAEGSSATWFQVLDWVVDKLGWALPAITECVQPPTQEPDPKARVRKGT